VPLEVAADEAEVVVLVSALVMVGEGVVVVGVVEVLLVGLVCTVGVLVTGGLVGVLVVETEAAVLFVLF
jgi:hypothetical protein